MQRGGAERDVRAGATIGFCVQEGTEQLRGDTRLRALDESFLGGQRRSMKSNTPLRIMFKLAWTNQLLGV